MSLSGFWVFRYPCYSHRGEQTMLALLKNEYIKVFTHWGFKCFFVFFVILAAIPIMSHTSVVQQINRIDEAQIISLTLSLFWVYIYNFTSYLLLKSELKTGTINLIAIRPFRRWKILMCKYITILSIAIIYSLLVSILQINFN